MSKVHRYPWHRNIDITRPPLKTSTSDIRYSWRLLWNQPARHTINATMTGAEDSEQRPFDRLVDVNHRRFLARLIIND
ncbi:hypothetical protein O9993_03125 [Vibrio lentus]|nr:hypothetical protein [Vibrio lentus]